MLASSWAHAAEDLPRPDKWIKVTTENFTIFSNANASKTKKTAVQLERFRQTLQKTTRGLEVSSDIPTTILVFKNDISFTPYKRRPDGDVRNVSGLFLSGLFGNYMTLDVAAASRPMRVVFHEYFHTVAKNSFGDLPLWLNEGLAEYYSTFRYNDISASAEVGRSIEEHLRYIGEYGMLPWAQLFETTPRSSQYNEGTRQGSFYAQAWVLVHYLNSSPEQLQRLSTYLSALRKGQKEEIAFAAAFGADRAALGAAAVAYMQTGSNYLVYDFEEEFGQVTPQVSEVAPAEIYFRLGDLLARTGPREPAEMHLRAALEAGWPAGPVYTSLGAAALIHDDTEAAEKWWRQALATEGESAEAALALGSLALQLSDAQSLSDFMETPESFREARALFGRGLEERPDHFDLLVSFARTFIVGADDAAPGVGAIRMARRGRPMDADAIIVEAALTARAGAVERAYRVIHDGLGKSDPDKADEAERQVTQTVLVTAFQHAEKDERERGVAMLDEALRVVQLTDVRTKIGELRELLDNGGVLVVAPEGSGAEDALARYNKAVSLANAGKLEQAVEELEAFVEDCDLEDLCDRARGQAADLRRVLHHNATVASINESIALYNANDFKKSTAILRELELELEPGELRDMLLQTMKSIGVRPAKKK